MAALPLSNWGRPTPSPDSPVTPDQLGVTQSSKTCLKRDSQATSCGSEALSLPVATAQAKSSVVSVGLVPGLPAALKWFQPGCWLQLSMLNRLCAVQATPMLEASPASGVYPAAF